MQKHIALTLITSTMLGGATPLHGQPLQVEARTRFTVENRYYALEIDAARGGQIRAFRYKAVESIQDRDWIYHPGGGLSQDKIWQQRHPGELQDFPYEYTILEQTPEIFRIALWRAFERPPYPGLMMHKVYTFAADSPAIRVRMSLKNPSDEDMFPGAWIQSRFYCGGARGDQIMYTPSFLGIRTASIIDGRSLPQNNVFVRRPAAGWAMTFDPDTRVGMLFLADFNYLRMFYSCQSHYTTEVFYDRVLLQPGGEWSTDYTLVPVSGVNNCFHADDELFITAEQDGDTIRFAAHAVGAAVPSVTLHVQAFRSDRSEKLAEWTGTLDRLVAGDPQAFPVTVPGSKDTAVIIAMTILSDGNERNAEFMYAADEAFYMLQESAVTYRAPIPRKIKPELMGTRELTFDLGETLSVFYGQGIWHEFNRVQDVLREMDPETDFTVSLFQTGVIGPELSIQPLLAEDLMRYHLVVLNNVGANALGEAGEIAVEQYVKAGGNLLVCGGLYSLGKSRWHEGPLEDVLPFATAGAFDIERLDGFHAIEGESNAGTVQWIQNIRDLHPEATVRLSVGGRPLLVEGTYGEGKVLVWLGTPLGEPPEGVVPYWRSPEWMALLRETLATLLNR